MNDGINQGYRDFGRLALFCIPYVLGLAACVWSCSFHFPAEMMLAAKAAVELLLGDSKVVALREAVRR